MDWTNISEVHFIDSSISLVHLQPRYYSISGNGRMNDFVFAALW